MFRADHITADSDANGTGKAGYTAGSLATQVPATVLTPDAMNAVQEELANAVEFTGAALVKADNDQLMRAMYGMMDGVGLATLYPGVTVAGANWTDAAVGRTASSVLPVLVVTRNNATDQVYSCTAGLHNADTLTARTLGSASANVIYAVAWSTTLSLFCVVGGGGEIQTSPDGTTWTRRTPAAAFAGIFRDVVWDDVNLRFVAVGASGTIQYSTNGTAWTAATAGSAYASTFYSVECINGTLVAVGASGEVQTSPDGVTWTRRVTGLGFDFLYAGASAHGFYAMAAASTYFSEDGVTWGSVSLGFFPTCVAKKSGALAGVPSGGGSFLFSAVHGGDVTPCALGYNGGGGLVIRTEHCWVCTTNNTDEVIVSGLLPF